MQSENKKKRKRVWSEVIWASSSDYKHIRVHCLEIDHEKKTRTTWID